MFFLAVAATPVCAHAADNPAEALEMPTVLVVGTSPLPGLGSPLRDVPANVQVLGAQDLAGHASIAHGLQGKTAGVSLTSSQGNAFQPELDFRGFAASPLLGTPQGISVFQDGVRVNESFGDLVNWDFIPRSAISSLQLIPGSNPLFGLNTLGGAVAIYTKSGSQYPGMAMEMGRGSFGRREVEAELGGTAEAFDYFLTANRLDEDGWARHNASHLRQFFGKLGWQDEKSDLDVAFTAADNRLDGSQTLPVSFLDDIRQAYTYPDRNLNRLAFLTLKGSRFVDDAVLVGGNLYLRRYGNENLSSNVNDDYDPVDKPVEAFNDRLRIDQDSWGGGLQATVDRSLWDRENRFMLGAGGDFAHARLRQDRQEARFAADRATLGMGAFSPETDAGTSTRAWALFASDILHLDPRWTLSLAARYDTARVRIRDRSGSAPQLAGDHRFARLNPALGLNFNPRADLTLYAGYSEGMRAPTAVELACADPDTPCKLPNNFLADPALKKVVAKTWESGGRGKLGQSVEWSAALYRSELDDDIQFVSSGGGLNAGYFRNVGRTRRLGLELSATMHEGALSLAIRVSHVAATYQSGFNEHSPDNPAADANGDIRVAPGKTIPGIPGDSLKIRAERSFGTDFTAGVDLLASSRVFARGDENNANGTIAGYALIDLDAQYKLSHGVRLIAGVANLFDRRYANFGVLGRNFFSAPGHVFGPAVGVAALSEPFRAIGAPRSMWLGLRYETR